ncbi:T9SS type A sorting domain-containing protein, partial [bacterium]|nr:T9SS type A sorting domain-containing protein [bacterium]
PALRLSARPNPFRSRTDISYTVGRAGGVELAVYDALGRRVRTLVRARQGPGTHAATFEAGTLPAGVYYCRLRAGDDAGTVKFVLMR